MRSVGIKVLKNRLSEYVRLAASGETVLVTDRDRVVAELVPPRSGPHRTAADAELADLIRRDIVAPATRRDEPLPQRRPVMTHQELMEIVDRDREDRR